MRTGCLPHNKALLATLPVVHFGAEPVPANVPTPTCSVMLGRNDVDPTCVPTALANAANLFCYKMRTGELVVPDSAILKLLAEAIGQPDATEAQLAACDGCEPLAAYGIAETQGWDIGEQVPIVPNLRVLGQQTRLGIAAAVARLGSCPVAVMLYESDMEAFSPQGIWNAPPGGDVEGGHMVCVGGYSGLEDSDTVAIATWGTWFPATWDWLHSRLQLALAVGWRQFMPAEDQSVYDALWSST